MTRVIDFDAFRAEQAKEPVVLRIGANDYEMPPALPASIAVEIIRMRATHGEDADVPMETFDTFGRSVFGADLWKSIIETHRITMDEVPDLMKMVMEAYNTDPKEETSTPETKAPSSSSSRTGRGSKRTSSASTA